MRKKFYACSLLILLLHQAGSAQTSMINVYGRNEFIAERAMGNHH